MTVAKAKEEWNNLMSSGMIWLWAT